jgi:hypothetical protein
MSDDDLLAIGARCDDANAWASAEIEAVLALPELRTAVSPEHMARRVVTRLSEEADERFLMLLTKLNTRTDAFRQAVARALATQEVGEIVAHQLRLEQEQTLEALGRFLVLSPLGIARAVMHGLLARASHEALALEALRSLAEWYGATQLCEWIQAPELREDTAAVLGAALSVGSPAANELSNLVIAAPIEAAVALLSAMPPELLAALGRPLRMLWGRAKPEHVEQVAELMVKGGAPENLRVLGELLLEGKCDKWPGRVLYALCAGLVQAGLGRSHLLPLIQKRNANEQLRIIAIDCVQRDAALIAEARRFRLGALFDSAAVRERLQRAHSSRPPPGASGGESR